MPIRGLTDRDEGTFPQIGIIRKGAPKTQNAPGKDLKHFRVEFDAKETQAQNDFVARFTDMPTDIIVMLPFNDIDRCWEAWQEAYVAGALIHRCDGEYIRYAIDPKTGEKLVINGLSLKDGRPVACRGKSDGCKPVGRLRVIVPELMRLAYMVVVTTSIRDIRNITSQLKGISQLTNGHIAGIPLILRRRPKRISTPSEEGGKRVRREKWLISIEADPDWVKGKISKMKHDALPGNELDETKQIATPIMQIVNRPEWTSDDEDDKDDNGDENNYPADHIQSAELITDRAPEPETPAAQLPIAPTTEQGDRKKAAILKYQPFVTWANEWVRRNGKQYTKDSDPNMANMYHLLARIGKLGFAQVTEQNADDIKVALENFVAGKTDPLLDEAAVET